MDVTDEFYDVVSCHDINKLGKYLQLFIDYLKESKKPGVIINEFYSYLSDECFYEREAAGLFYKLFNEKESIPEFIYNHWTFYDNSEKDIRQLESIVYRICTCMYPPQAPRISDSMIHELIDLTEKKFQFGTKVLKNHPIKILKINQTYEGWGCYYLAGISNGVIGKDAIVMTCPHHPQTHQEFGFVHELRHRLHTSLTHQTFVPPASFSCFREYLPEQIQNNRSMAEHFANLFAIAALNNSEYEHCIPHEVSAEDITLFEKYMLLTITTMNENAIYSIEDLS